MSNITIFEEEFDNVAGFKMPDTLGNTVTYLEGGGTPTLQTKTKTYTPTESQQTETVGFDSGYDGLEEVDVTVNAISSTYVGSGIDRNDSTDLTASGNTITAPAGYYESSASKAVASGTEGTPTATKGTVSNHSVSVTPSVTNTAGYISGGTHSGTAVTVSASELDSGTKPITANGTGIDVVGYAAVDVNVSGGGNLQNKTKTYTPTESQQTESVSADTGYDGLGTVDVTVNAISSSYVGSGVTRRTSTDLSVSGATVTAPAGYYENSASASVPSGSATTPATTVTANPSISVNPSTGLITVTASASQSITPSVTAGYVSSGTAGTITVSGSNTEQLTTQAAQTLYPSATDQTIASGKYLTGAQTIAAVTTTNLTAANIKNGVTVEVGDSSDSDRVLSITGTYQGGGSVPAPYTQMATGSVTIASRYQTTGNRLIVSLATIGFTPKQFLLIATSATVKSIYDSQDNGTEANGVVIYADFVSLSDGTHTFSARSNSRLSAMAMSGGRANSSWTTQTNNYLYNNGTNIYFRTASNYGLPANGVYNWIAFA